MAWQRSRPNSESPSPSPAGAPLLSRDDLRVHRTRLALVLERFAPPLLLPAGLILAFLALAWSGAFAALGPLARAGLTAGFGLAFLASLLRLRGVRWPDTAAIAARLDASRPDLHRPLAALADRPASDDGVALALWDAHRRRAEQSARVLAAGPGDPRLREKDPVALRLAVVLSALVAFGLAGEERLPRLAAAFDWTTPRAPEVPPRLDVWIDPPTYTGKPPIFLSGTPGEGEAIRAPAGSIVQVRSAAALREGRKDEPPALDLAHGSGLAVPPPPPPLAEGAKPPTVDPSVRLARRILNGDDRLVVRLGSREVAAYRLVAIPDEPPRVDLRDARAESANRERQEPGGLRLAYTLHDDYGIAKAELRLRRAGSAPEARTLFPAPTTHLSLRIGAGEAAVPTEDHPWAGETVQVSIEAEDDLGQKAESAAKTVTLPARTFTQPLARALVEQRRQLNFDPDRTDRVALALDALLFAPERFTPAIGDYMAIDFIRAQLRSARGDDDLREVANALWDLALHFENGDMTEAERRLREAEARLREALERGAPQDEIRRLAEELRRAMDQFLREFAERALQNRDPNADRNAPPVNPENLLTQRDLQDMLRRIEEMARSGNMAEAQRLLNELRQLMENLRSARRQDVDPRLRELGRQIEELDRLQRDQRDLRDRTFREKQQRQGQQGQPRQRQQGPRQRGQQPGQQGGEPSLEEQQQALRDRLRQLRERLRQNGMNEGEGMGEADEGMGEAEGRLGQGQPGQAPEGQQRALDGLGRAAQGMAEQLQRQLGQGEGEGEGEPGPGQPGPTQRGRADSRTDPLGRPRPNPQRDHEDTSRIDENGPNSLTGTIHERAEQVLRELRKRLGEFERPREELEYLDRLLRQR